MDNADKLRAKFRNTVVHKMPSAFDMISSGMKTQFNLTNPEHGIKGYKFPNAELEDFNYKIPAFPVQKCSKFREGYLYNHLKSHSFVPGAKDVPFLHEWGKDPYFKHSAELKRGKMPTDPKITWTHRTMKEAKRNNYPGSKYKFKDEF